MISTPAPRSSYQPHINGLRALAILGVLFYHLRAGYCPAGYFGVDVFLVISGFLLLRSLLKQGSEHSFHYGSYLLKKSWRILPSWFLVTVATCATAMWLMSDERVVSALHTARYSAIFCADYEIDLSGDYFNTFSQQNPLLHFWYLSITEQLYIILPLLVVPLLRFTNRKVTAWALLLPGLLSLGYYMLTTFPGLLSADEQKNLMAPLGMQTVYYHLLPRLWEILAGAGILLMPTLASHPRLRGFLALAGLLGIAASYYLYETGSSASYLAVISALLTLRYGDTGLCGRILGLKPVQAIGTISFSLYLWHWPLMVFWKYYRFDQPSPWDEVGMIAASLLLAALFWFCVERLKMPGKTRWVKALLYLLVLLTLPLTYYGSLRAYNDIAEKTARELKEKTPWNYRGYNVDFSNVKDNPDILRGFPPLKEFESGKKHGFQRPPYTIGNPQAEGIPYSFMLIGDSHAIHLYNGMHQVCQEMGIRGVYLNNSCIPYWFLQETTRQSDASWSPTRAEQLLAYLEAHPSIRYVLIAQLWEHRTSRDSGSDWRTDAPITSREQRRAIAAEGLRETCRILKSMGRQPILLGDTPHFNAPAPADEWDRCQKMKMEAPERCVTLDEHQKRQKFSTELMKQLDADGLACYIDLAEALLREGKYPAQIDGSFLYGDIHHMTPAGSLKVARMLMPELLRMGAEDGVPMQAEQQKN